MRWTEKQISDLKKAGKIKGYSTSKPVVKSGGGIPAKKRSSGLDWLDLNLAYWCNERSLTLEKEYRFDPERKWRFDYFIPAYKVGIEFEGGIFLSNSGHKTAKHYTKDTEKYNRAATLGFRVIRVTAMNYKTVITHLEKICQ